MKEFCNYMQKKITFVKVCLRRTNSYLVKLLAPCRDGTEKGECRAPVNTAVAHVKIVYWVYSSGHISP